LEPRGHEVSLVSPNKRALVSSVKFAPLSEVKGVSPSADSIAYAASALRDASKVHSCKARTKALYSASYLRRNAKIEAPLCAKSKATIALLLALSSAKLALGGEAKSLASSSEAHAISEAISTSPMAERRILKDRVLQLEQPSHDLLESLY